MKGFAGVLAIQVPRPVFSLPTTEASAPCRQLAFVRAVSEALVLCGSTEERRARTAGQRNSGRHRLSGAHSAPRISSTNAAHFRQSQRTSRGSE